MATTGVNLPVRRRRMSKRERSAMILDAAEELFADRGFHAVSMDDVAAQVGVSKPVIYENFGSKDLLLVALVQRVRADLLEQVATVASVATAVDDLFRLLATGAFEYADAHPKARAILLSEHAAHGPAAQAMDAVRREQTVVLVGLMSRFGTPRHPLEFEVLAEMLAGGFERLVRWRVGHPEVATDGLVDMLMSTLWGGLERFAAERMTVPAS